MNYLTKIIAYGLYLLAFTLPWQTRWIIRPGFTEYQTYSLYGTDILLLVLLSLFLFVIARSLPACLRTCLRATHRQRQAQAGVSDKTMTNKRLVLCNKRKVWFFILGLILTSGVSVLFAADKPLAFYKFGWLVLGAGLFWLVIRAEYDRAKLVWSLLSGLVLQAGLAIWQFLEQETFASKWLGLSLHRASELGVSVIETVGTDGIGERWLRAYGGLDHPNILGGALVVGIFLLIGQIVMMEQVNNFQIIFNVKILKIIFWLFLIIFTAALFFSFSRTAWLALAIGLAVILFRALVKKNLLAQKEILRAVLIFGLIFFILFFQLPNLLLTRLYAVGRLETKSSSGRLESIKSSLPIIKKNWAVGTGIGNYTLALERDLPGQETFYYQPAHNAFLLVWAETGIAGLIFFILLLFVMYSEFNQRLPRRPSTKYWRGTPRNDKMIAIIIAFIVLMSFDHWLWSLHFGVLFFWLIMGLTMHREDEKLNPPNPLC